MSLSQWLKLLISFALLYLLEVKVWDLISLSHTILSFRILGQPPLMEEDVLFSLLPCTEMYAISMVTFLTYNLTNLVQSQLMI